MNHLPSGIRILVKGIRLVMRTYCAVSTYTFRPREVDAAVAVNHLVQVRSLSLGCFVFLGYRPSLIAIRLQQVWKEMERKGKERGSCGAETQ